MGQNNFMDQLRSGFDQVYSNNLWGAMDAEFMNRRRNTKFYSGGGTDPENDRDNRYVNLIQEFVDMNDVKTVVEIGCGDWEVSGRINWDGVDYVGYDVVSDLVEYNTKNFSNESIKFLCEDIIHQNKISADLLIAKDVFQHLPASFCSDFVRSIPKNFKYNVITNDYDIDNIEIPFAGYRGNDFTAPPFSMRCHLFFEWQHKFRDAGIKYTFSVLG